MTRPLLRFLMCGSVDDGKSSLIGRLLLQSGQIMEDQIRSVERDSIKFGTLGDRIDPALLVDGLAAEREQGITIDVAYRFFETPARRFIVADTPGHEQYTRNMATAASTASLAVLLVDARKGILVQTRRHARIAAMLGVPHVVLAVNKMDLVDWDPSVYRKIVDEYQQLSETLGFASLNDLPVSALTGANVASRAGRAEWCGGPSLLEFLESVDSQSIGSTGVFHMPVQYVNRPSADFRGFCGRVVGGPLRAGDIARIAPTGIQARIKSIVVLGGEAREAGHGESITLTLEDDVDVSRGDVISSVKSSAPVADQFQAHVIWMSSQPLVAGRSYLLKVHTKVVNATITSIKYQIDVDTGAHLAAKSLGLNALGVVNVSLDRKVLFDAYKNSRSLGSFILIDRTSNETAGAGMIDFALRRSDSIHEQDISIDWRARAQAKGQKPLCVWLTGLSGSGKSTLANLVEKRLHLDGRHTYLIDGDNVRRGLNRDLGFVEADRVENIRRVAEAAKMMVDAGLIVIVSLISPYRADREMARSLFREDAFLEVYLTASVEDCEKRDAKGLYAKARRGELKNFTGIDSPYEPPLSPDVSLNTGTSPVMEGVDQLVRVLEPLIKPENVREPL